MSRAQSKRPAPTSSNDTMPDILVAYGTALDLMDEARSIAALIAAALRTYDVDAETTPTATAALLESLTGILMLAKLHDKHTESAFEI